MSQKSEMLETTDPVEIRRQVEEMFAEPEGTQPQPQPQPEPSRFTDGEKIPMHQFLSRFQKYFCAGVVPDFYMREVRVVSTSSGRLYFSIDAAPPAIQNPKSKIQNVVSPAPVTQGDASEPAAEASGEGKQENDLLSCADSQSAALSALNSEQSAVSSQQSPTIQNPKSKIQNAEVAQ